MQPKLWQRTLLAFIALACIHVVLDIVGGFDTGELGARVRAASDRRHFTIVKVTAPESFSPPVREGETFAFADFSLGERIRYAKAIAGDRFTLIMDDGRRVTATIHYSPPTVLDFTYAVLRLAMLAMAAIIAIRRPDRPDARTLANFLAIFGFAILIQPQPFFPNWLTLGWIFVKQSALLVALAQVLQLATIFPDPHARGIRGILRRLNPYVTAIFLAALNLDLYLAIVTLVKPPDLLTAIATSANFYYIAAITVAFWIANVRSSPAEKSRVRWISFTIAVGFSGIVVELPLYYNGISAWWVGLFGLTLIAIPLGLAYAVLRHRVIDVGFAVNRALVFAVLSAFVVIAFGTVEWFLGKFVVEKSHITSASIEALLALALGASMRSIHARVERVADDLFFRARHRSEAALRRFTLDVPFITDLPTLYERTISAVREHAEAADAALYLADDEGRIVRVAGGATMPTELDDNDPLFVRLRATREPVAVHELGSALDAELACPFVVRGRIGGALVCAAKRDGEAYAPDERTILADLARAVGAASDVLYTEALRREIEHVLGEKPSLALARGRLRPATGGAQATV